MSDDSEWTIDNLIRKVNRLEIENERLEAALRKISGWAKGYPLETFQEPDFVKVNEVLKTAGIPLAQVATAIRRRCIAGVGRVAESALKGW